MSRRKITGLVLLGLFVLGISAFGVRVLSQSGEFTTLKSVRSAKCEAYGDIPAPEDIAVEEKSKAAFISVMDSGVSRFAKVPPSSTRGSVRALDLTTITAGAKPEIKDVTPPEPKLFQPLGLSLFTDPQGNKRLFVINQAGGPGQHSVEIYRLNAGALKHEKTVELGIQVTFANDVIAVAPERFYVTDSAVSGLVSLALNFSFQRRRSQVFYYDGNKTKPAARNFVLANGIAKSKDGRQVYVLDTFARSLRFFSRDASTGDLTDSGVLFVGTGVDNVSVGTDDSLWIGAHPKLLDYLLYGAGFRSKSPSQVIHAVPGKSGGGVMRTVYLDSGEQISASSVAVAYKNGFIIGSSLDNKLVICNRS